MLKERLRSHRNALKNQDRSNALVKHFDNIMVGIPAMMTDFQIDLIGPQLKNHLRKLNNFGSTVNSSGLTVEPCDMKIATSKPKRKTEQLSLIIPFSRTAKITSDIVNHHFQILKHKLLDVFEHQITTAYTRHNNLRYQLVRSALCVFCQNYINISQ